MLYKEGKFPVSAMIKASLWNRLIAYANKNNMSMAAVITLALESHFEKEVEKQED